MPDPEISLILPTQGARASLARALRSALAQDFAALEIIVVDDSVDGPGWRQRSDLVPLLAEPRVCVVDFHQRRGCAAAKNAGLRMARGNWVCYLDDDNEYRPAKVREQHALALATESPLVLCGLEIRVRRRRRIRQVHTHRFTGDELVLATVPDTNVLFHLRDCGVWWDESLETGDDGCFFQAVIARHNLGSVPNVPAPLTIYYAHGGARANRALVRVYRGQRRLLHEWTSRYSTRARRIALLRALLACEKFRAGRWTRFGGIATALLRAGGFGELRAIVNAAGAKLPLVRRWMIS